MTFQRPFVRDTLKFAIDFGAAPSNINIGCKRGRTFEIADGYLALGKKLLFSLAFSKILSKIKAVVETSQIN